MANEPAWTDRGPDPGNPDCELPNELDLPPLDTVRWVARRKAQVVTAVKAGLISLEEACVRYALSVEEFRAWQERYEKDGLRGLRARSKPSV